MCTPRLVHHTGPKNHCCSLWEDLDHFLYDTDKNGVRYRSCFLNSENFLEVFFFGEPLLIDERQLVHALFCQGCVLWTEVKRTTAQMAGSTALFKTYAGSLANVQQRVKVWVSDPFWEVACISRWTHQFKLRQWFMLACVGSGVIVMTIRSLQLMWSCPAEMARALEIIVAADAGDFWSKNKLKVLKVANTRCKPKRLDRYDTVLEIGIKSCVCE